MKRITLLLAFLMLITMAYAQRLGISISAAANYAIPEMPTTETIRQAISPSTGFYTITLGDYKTYTREVKIGFGVDLGLQVDYKLLKNRSLFLTSGLQFQVVNYTFEEKSEIQGLDALDGFETTFPNNNPSSNSTPVTFGSIIPFYSTSLIFLNIPIGLEWRIAKWNIGAGLYAALPMYCNQSYSTSMTVERSTNCNEYFQKNIGAQASLAYQVAEKMSIQANYNRSLSNIYADPIDLENRATTHTTFSRIRTAKLNIFSLGIAYKL